MLPSVWCYQAVSTDLKINVLNNKAVVFEKKNAVNDSKEIEKIKANRIFTKDRKIEVFYYMQMLVEK